jgi:predicted ATPase
MTGALLTGVTLQRERVQDWDEFPFSVPCIRNLTTLTISQPVCFFAGENGSGKSTLLEAIANNFGFGAQGGSKNTAAAAGVDNSARSLGRCLRLSWRRKPMGGYYLRSESFFNIATLIDEIEASALRPYQSYGGKSLHLQSHGESFLALFQHRYGADGFYLLDEPEAALSVQRQLSFLVILHQLVMQGHAQFFIATHSPILLAYPQAQIFSFDSESIKEVTYEETTAYEIASGFLRDPQAYLKHLLM